MSTNNNISKRYLYTAFGLHIASDIPFAKENGDGRDVDVLIRVESLPKKWLADARAKDGYVEIDGADIWFVWEDLGVMKIHAGRDIILDPIPDAQDSLVNQAIQSAGLGLLLYQRNTLTLHASAVEVNGGVVAFVGYKGAGKSTTAASLLAHGHALVTDDLLALNFVAETNEICAFPGIPQLRLWPESVAASLGENPELLPRNSSLSTKRLRDVNDTFTRRALPLQAIYVLDFHEDPEDHQVQITPVSPRDACVELVRHSFALHYLGNQGASVKHLAQSRLLTRNVPIRLLKRPRALQALPGMVNAILDDMEKLQVVRQKPRMVGDKGAVKNDQRRSEIRGESFQIQ